MTYRSCDAKLLNSIIKHRRDVRGNRFLDKKISKKKIKKILKAGLHAPSVGYSQPWKFVIIKSKRKREKIYKNFKKEFKKSKKYFKNPLYTKLKLEGILESPLNIAVFYKKQNKTEHCFYYLFNIDWFYNICIWRKDGFCYIFAWNTIFNNFLSRKEGGFFTIFVINFFYGFFNK